MRPDSPRWLTLFMMLAAVLCAGRVCAQDDPHSAGQNITCMSCHLGHDVFGNMIGSVEGSANLCLSCHQAGGQASKHPFAEHNQSSLQADAAAQAPSKGTSHRWDSGSAGRVEPVGDASENAIQSEGLYTGRYAVTYAISISIPGDSGTAKFDWVRTGPGTASGSNIVTGRSVPLDEGIRLTFQDLGPSPAFRAGQQWLISARPGITVPSNPDLLSCMPGGNKTVCVTCHDPHSQEKEPFDAAAPAYNSEGGAGRHFLRAPADLDQMCAECHAGLFVTNSTAGSHPVGMLVTSNALLHAPSSLPLDKQEGRVRCETCHQVHDSANSEGTLLRTPDERQLCLQCHALADTTGAASHLNAMTGPLWPGGQYGSLKPAESDVSRRGSCVTCHDVHGWPDPSGPTNNYPVLLTEKEENLCYTCHDGSPTKNIRSTFTKAYTHPVALSGRHTTSEDGNAARYGTANRHSECADCHNVHRLTQDPVPPTPPFASTAMKSVPRVSVNNVSASSVTYQFRSASDPTPAKEYEVCFVCHSGWATQPAGQSNHAAKFNDKNLSFHPVEAVGKNLNINPVTFTNGWSETKLTYCTDCHTSDDTAVRGPHGSANQWILKKPYSRATTPALASNGLCFECHSYAVYGANAAGSRFRNVSRTGHNHGGYNCYACHESHGSSTKPFLLGNNLTTYTKTATGGTCDPSCHGSESYTIAYPR